MCKREVMGVDGWAVESSNRYSGDGHGDRGSSLWWEFFGVLKFIGFQQ